jgi:Uri superfamily endonuclease
MVNYTLGKIYRITCNKTGLTYIGSCTTSLSARIACHKQQLKKGRNCTSFITLENEDFSIILIEDYPCERREQLLARERYWIDNMDCVNKVLPCRTSKEYYQDNREEIIKKQMVWNNDNRDKLYSYQKRYRDKLSNAYEGNIQMHEIYDNSLKSTFFEVKHNDDTTEINCSVTPEFNTFVPSVNTSIQL